jgi:DNA-binding Lrp family transcriptional regulator
MGKDNSAWRDARRAWERLNGWHQDNPAAKPGHRDDGGSALDALTDVGVARRLLDQAELVAVRTARQHGRSWAEIATKLGVTRQSAWERWRELDDTAAPSSTGPVVDPDATLDAEVAARHDRAARDRRRRSSVVVPNVVGMSWDDARHTLQEVSLVGVGSDPDGPPLAALGWPDGEVIDQSPESGAKVPPGSPVTLWIERGGGSAGVREPRRPKPSPRTAREMREEPSNEAVG